MLNININKIKNMTTNVHWFPQSHLELSDINSDNSLAKNWIASSKTLSNKAILEWNQRNNKNFIPGG